MRDESTDSDTERTNTKCKCKVTGDLVSFLLKTKYLDSDAACEDCGGYFNA